MRLPLVPILLLLFINLLIDFYLWRRLKISCRKGIWAKIQIISAVAFNLVLLFVICLPKRSGGDAGFDRIMWALYAYLSIYFPKLVFIIFDLLASLPTIWHHRKIKSITITGAILAAATFIAMWWGAIFNRYNIDVCEVEIEIPGLPEEFNGYTIAQISDMHVGSYGSDTTFLSRVVREVNGLNPDMIAFTGDIVNRRSSELKPFVGTLKGLKAKDGVFSILGNHDYGDYYTWKSESDKQVNMDELYDMQQAMGWKMLNNETAFIHRSNDSIAIIGVENVGDPPFRTYGDLDAAYSTLGDPVTKILLSHNPAHWVNDIKDAPDKNIALTLSGHTHAMQMSAFGFSPAALRYDTWGGLYGDNDNHQLYVNIGIGEVAIPARIGATPEITLITLKAK